MEGLYFPSAGIRKVTIKNIENGKQENTYKHFDKRP